MSTTPLTPAQWLRVLKAEGVDVREYRSWTTHERDDETGKVFGPVNGVVIHHTAGSNSLSLCYNGTASLPGPLCHTHMSKTGIANMTSAGRANHGGTFAQNAHNAVLAESPVHPYPDAAEPVDANDRYYGIEPENLGNGTDKWPWKQWVALVKWATAICRHHGWNQDSVIGHKEGTRRKIDPKGPVIGPDGTTFDFTMNRFRADVKAALARPAGVWPNSVPEEEEDVALTEEEIAKIAHRVWAFKNLDIDPRDMRQITADAASGAKTAATVAQEVENKVDNLTVGGGVDLDVLAAKVADVLAARLAA